MQDTNSYLSMLKAEHFKIKRNITVLVFMLCPLFISLFVDFIFIYKGADDHEGAMNIWLFLGLVIFLFYSLLYPLLIAILCYSLCDTEYKHNAIKQLLTLPVTKLKIFLAKSTLLVEIIFVSVLISYAMFLLSGYSVGHILYGGEFLKSDTSSMVNIFFIRMFITCLAIAFVQFLLSLSFRNMTVSVGFACFGVVLMLVANSWDYIYMFPYRGIFAAYNDFVHNKEEFITKAEIANLFYIFLCGVLCYWSFCRLSRKK